MHDRRDLVEQHQVVAAHDCVAVVEAEDVLDLLAVAAGDALQVAGVVLHQPAADATALPADQVHQDRKSVESGKSVSVRVDLGGRRLIKKKKTNTQTEQMTHKQIIT